MTQKVLVLLLSVFLISGCQTGTTPVTPNGSRLDAVPILTPTRTVGTGSGDLAVDGKALGILPGEVIAITPGRYTSLTFTNLNGLAATPISVVANDLVEIVGGGMTLENVSYLTIDGDPAAKNLYFHDNTYRGITISGAVPHALTLQGIRAKNVADYMLIYTNNTAYDQTDATAFTDFKLLYCDFDNAGTIQFTGTVSRAGGSLNTGFMKNPEIAYCTFENDPTAGTLLHLGNAENMNVHHNVVDNINTQNDNHNGIFFLKGNGSAHHNKCTNHQGNFIRFWPFSQGNIPKDVLLYNNIVWNSRKYSALELQSFSDNIIPGISTFCNAKVYNNTVGRMNTTLPTVFVGVVVDVYNLYGGNLQIFNNLSFEEVRTWSNDGIWSEQSITRPSLYTNNLNFATAADAGLVDVSTFKLLPTSLAKHTGLYRLFLLDDYYGTLRSIPPSIGAVE